MIELLTGWLASAVDWTPAFHERLGAEHRASVTIADLDEALTFARIEREGRPLLVAVTRWKDGSIDAVDLSALAGGADAVGLATKHDYDELAAFIRDSAPELRVTAAAGELLLPVDFDDRHIAVGTNYPEHASDAGTTRPFLFPKRVQPGVSGDEVSAHGGLLDYEVEIAVVPLEPVGEGSGPRRLGLMLANDFTDRETLMHAVDRGDIESGKGFTTGKSFPGYLPLGALFVVPRDYRTFARTLELELYVNEALRQRAPASEMVWDIDEVLARSLACKGRSWEHRGAEVALFDGDAIRPRTLVLTGTPHGTVFAGVGAPVIAAGLARWLFGGWSETIPKQVIAAYVDAARSAEAYLQPGDEVLIHVERLGQIRSRVIP